MKLPDKYAKLGVATGFVPTPADKLRIIVEGKTGDGKTTFVCGSPGTIILDLNQASGNVYDRRAAACPISTWEDYAAVKQMLLDDLKAKSCPFTRFAIDDMDSFIEMVDQHIVTEKREQFRNNPESVWNRISSVLEFGSEGAGYRILRTEVMKEVNQLFLAGLPWTLVCQMKPNPAGTKETAMRILMAPSMFGLVTISADMCVRLSSREASEDIITTRTIGGKQQTFKTGQRTCTKYFLSVRADNPMADEKRRILGLDADIELPPVGGWTTFERAYNTAIEKLRSGEYFKIAAGGAPTTTATSGATPGNAEPAANVAAGGK
jgi:hypothetical protein